MPHLGPAPSASSSLSLSPQPAAPGPGPLSVQKSPAAGLVPASEPGAPSLASSASLASCRNPAQAVVLSARADRRPLPGPTVLRPGPHIMTSFPGSRLCPGSNRGSSGRGMAWPPVSHGLVSPLCRHALPLGSEPQGPQVRTTHGGSQGQGHACPWVPSWSALLAVALHTAAWASVSPSMH